MEQELEIESAGHVLDLNPEKPRPKLQSFDMSKMVGRLSAQDIEE